MAVVVPHKLTRGLLLCCALLAAHVTLAQTERGAAPSGRSTVDIPQALQRLNAWVEAHQGKLSASIVDVDNGTVLAEVNPKLALNPASNMKLLTAAAALDRLGPSFSFHTGLYGHRNGDSVSEVVLRGDGDPSLLTVDLWQLAHELRQTGITRVGAILVDQSRFDAQFVPPAFEQQPDELAAFRAPVSAVAVDDNAVTLHVIATELDAAARVWLDPPGVVDALGEIKTGPTGSKPDLRWKLTPKSGRLVATLAGHVPAGSPPQTFTQRLDDPRLVPGYVLRQSLRDLGVSVGDRVVLGGESATERLAIHESAPLAVLVRELGKASNNFYAEMLLKTLGAKARGAPGSSEAGCDVVRTWLTEHDAFGEGTVLKNGSGLFDADRVSAWTLTHTLRAAFANPRIHPEYLEQLSIGGVDGTLSARFRAYRENRLIRAKTGTLNKSDALSGFVLGSGQRGTVAFALLIDGVAGHHEEAHRELDAVVNALAEHALRAPQHP